MSRVPIHTAAHVKEAAVAVWLDIDTWFRRRDGEAAPATVLIEAEEPAALPDRFGTLLERLDQVAAEHKRSKAERRGGHYSGRRRALIANQELARAFYELCLVEGVAPIRGALELSRQSLQDVWTAQGWKAPGRRDDLMSALALVLEHPPRGAHNGLPASLAGGTLHPPAPAVCLLDGLPPRPLRGQGVSARQEAPPRHTVDRSGAEAARRYRSPGAGEEPSPTSSQHEEAKP
jgi:hypothetical protein